MGPCVVFFPSSASVEVRRTHRYRKGNTCRTLCLTTCDHCVRWDVLLFTCLDLCTRLPSAAAQTAMSGRKRRSPPFSLFPAIKLAVSCSHLTASSVCEAVFALFPHAFPRYTLCSLVSHTFIYLWRRTLKIRCNKLVELPCLLHNNGLNPDDWKPKEGVLFECILWPRGLRVNSGSLPSKAYPGIWYYMMTSPTSGGLEGLSSQHSIYICACVWKCSLGSGIMYNSIIYIHSVMCIWRNHTLVRGIVEISPAFSALLWGKRMKGFD